ncbi:hypothetical protein ACFL0W_03010 [Nanoarchaeota archaeon]
MPENPPQPIPGQPGIPEMHGIAPAEPKKPHSGGFAGFFGKHPSPTASSMGNMAELAAEVNAISRHLRVLEERYDNLRKKTQVTDQNMLSANKTMNTEIKAIDSDVQDFRKEFDDMKENLRLIVKELKQTAKSEDVKTLEKYLELWQPVQFVTRKQVEMIVRGILAEQPQQKIPETEVMR